MSERHPVLAAWDRLAEKLRKEGLTKHEVRYVLPRQPYLALVWTELSNPSTPGWRIMLSTRSYSWGTYHEEDVDRLMAAAIYAPDFVRLVRRTHLILHSEEFAIANIDLATEA